MRPNRVIATYDTEEEARHAVEALADRKIPTDRVAIVAEGASFFRRFRDRMGKGTAALVGAAVGGLIGALLGLTLGLTLLTVPGFFIGALIGAFVGPAARDQEPGPAPRREIRRDVRFDVVADRDVADRARQALFEAEHRV